MRGTFTLPDGTTFRTGTNRRFVAVSIHRDRVVIDRRSDDPRKLTGIGTFIVDTVDRKVRGRDGTWVASR